MFLWNVPLASPHLSRPGRLELRAHTLSSRTPWAHTTEVMAQGPSDHHGFVFRPGKLGTNVFPAAVSSDFHWAPGVILTTAKKKLTACKELNTAVHSPVEPGRKAPSPLANQARLAAEGSVTDEAPSCLTVHHRAGAG